MASNNKKLRENPYTTYRDPVTGRWLVIRLNQQQTRSAG